MMHIAVFYPVRCTLLFAQASADETGPAFERRRPCLRSDRPDLEAGELAVQNTVSRSTVSAVTVRLESVLYSSTAIASALARDRKAQRERPVTLDQSML